jgi:predicted phosphohydrolase
MTIWAIADLHLALSVPGKNMAVFGPLWDNYMERIEAKWRALVHKDDLVLLAGDLCWAMRLEEAKVELGWLEQLPGTKLLLRGNHDYWWASSAKMASFMPPSVHFIHNTAFNWHDVTIGGARLWDTDEYNFHSYIHFQDNPRAAKKEVVDNQDREKIFCRELERLKLSLQQLNPSAKKRIAMTHYPPISADLKPSRTAKILEEFQIELCVFGHLHNLKKDQPLFGERQGVRYVLTSADYLDFTPVRLL